MVMKNNILQNKKLWIITIAVFVLLITFFDRNNLLNRWEVNQRIGELETQRKYYLDKIREDSVLMERLKDDEFLERYAREHYLMKRDGEQIYVIAQ